MSGEITATIVRPKTQKQPKIRRQPRYHVILLDDNDHTYDYVVRMLWELFGYPHNKAYKLAQEVDSQGRVILLTTTREHAELKQEQVHAYGKDELIPDCSGSMTAILEPSLDS